MATKILPPAYFLSALIVMAGVHAVLPGLRLWAYPVSLVGLLPLAAGVFLNATADREFKRHRTTVKPFEWSRALVTTFPFSASRNPMYVGLTLMLLGVATLLGTASPFVPALVFPVLMDRLFIRKEEAMLAEAFGAEWQRYRDAVRRWI